jgi:hypothetical protein
MWKGDRCARRSGGGYVPPTACERAGPPTEVGGGRATRRRHPARASKRTRSHRRILSPPSSGGACSPSWRPYRGRATRGGPSATKPTAKTASWVGPGATTGAYRVANVARHRTTGGGGRIGRGGRTTIASSLQVLLLLLLRLSCWSYLLKRVKEPCNAMVHLCGR